jgi:FkbM family methyltransferase
MAYKLGEVLGDEVLLGKTRGGSVMALSMRDHQHRAIYFYGEYEPEITDLFQRLVTPGCTVFDVGANAGYFSLLSCECGAAHVHAFEPNPAVRSLLAQSSKLSSGDIEVVPAACSDHDGRTTLYVATPANTGKSSLKRKTENSVEVDLITLDGYARDSGARPDLIKVDVEGSEFEVLRGARSLLETARPTVIAETKNPDVLDLMKSFGYTPNTIRLDGSTAVYEGQFGARHENLCFLPDINAPEKAAA